MATNEKFALVFGLLGLGCLFGPQLPEFIDKMAEIRDEFFALNPTVVSVCFGCLFLSLAIAFSLVSLARLSAKSKTWPTPDEEDPKAP